jgi:hypothetical protein
LQAIGRQVDAINKEAAYLTHEFPDARDLIEGKRDEVTDSWNMLRDRVAQRKNKLILAESLQQYFSDYRELK